MGGQCLSPQTPRRDVAPTTASISIRDGGFGGDGTSPPLLCLTGATNRHDRIVRNALIAVGTQLDGQHCQPFTADIFIVIPAGNRRHGDIGVDRGTPDEGSMAADAPALVMEILSPTNRALDFQDKIEEYKTVPTLEYILLVDPDTPTVRIWRRNADRVWIYERVSGLEEVLDLSVIGVTLPLARLYAGLTFRLGPRLVEPKGAPPGLRN